MIKIISVVVFFFAVVGCKPVTQAAHNTSSKVSIPQQGDFVCLVSQSQCDVDVEYGNFDIQFSQAMQEGKIQTELPFYIKLNFNGAKGDYQLKSITSYLEGKSMFMGKIPVFFQEGTDNSMMAESLLANCSEEIMTWRLWFKVEVLVDNERKQQDFFVDFDSQRL